MNAIRPAFALSSDLRLFSSHSSSHLIKNEAVFLVKIQFEIQVIIIMDHCKKLEFYIRWNSKSVEYTSECERLHSLLEYKEKIKRERKCYHWRLPNDSNKEHHYYTDDDGR